MVGTTSPDTAHPDSAIGRALRDAPDRGAIQFRWHRWFAWRPVRTYDGRWIWFETVYRRFWLDRRPHWSDDSGKWEYFNRAQYAYIHDYCDILPLEK